ncbi:MAG: electron transfer flavoprotein subunit alpha/FixB family protein [Ignavibacteriales bacterium]|nr:MAG: electron transfer flavoprotein subunit alpha/FixB family protein [Ignavibacteriales bacterium]
MPKKILIFIEQRENKLKKTSYETATVAHSIASALGYETEAVVIGGEIENINTIQSYGLNKIVHFKNSDLINYSSSAYKNIVSGYAKETGAEYVIFPNSSLGKDLAPLVSVNLNAGIIMDIIDFTINDNTITLTRPVYAGKALMDVKFNSDVKVFTLRPNVFKPVSSDSSTEIEIRNVDNPNLTNRVTESKKSEGKLDVAEADIIVSGGRGMKGPENFHLIEELADALGAAVGASRAVVDAGWRPHREQVGQTGKTVSPSLYVACGISGAIQHLAGMSSAKYIVAINKDKDSPIFNIADYGIAGDIFEILPAFTEEVRKLKA